MNSLNPQETRAEILVPPRPNLGPEPWTAPPAWNPAGWGLAALTLLALLIGRRAIKRKKAKVPGQAEATTASTVLDRSPRQRLIASSEDVRSALIRTFGANWGSKTTEEIGSDPGLAGKLDPTVVEQLRAFLRFADWAKFAQGEPETLEDWENWAGQFVLGLTTVASSKSDST